ncbi:MAG: peptide chain release factor 3 [Planctomycetales bacterium]
MSALISSRSHDPRQPPAQPCGNHSTGAANGSLLKREIRRRRTFAIISHPDAGKTTLTEKLLLYAGCVDEAGMVRGRKTQRAVTSDWMAMERERGISVTSTVLGFPYRGYEINLLDTPGHQDFSEDTYRTLTAADCAVMVLDAVKGVEPQTIKLFKICAARKIPILTFVNKMDRPGGDPLRSLSEIEEVLGIDAVPLNWPIGGGADFCGVYDRLTRQALRFSSESRGRLIVPFESAELDRAGGTILTHEEAQRLRDEVGLLDGAGAPFDRERFLRGEQTPVFFGSALTNFGVEPFLDAFLELAPAPGPRASDRGLVPPEHPRFAGVVFKIQANLDPKHRDRIAFVRVCAGRFRREMEVLLARTGEKIRIMRSHRLFARDRETTDEAFPGDVIGVVNPRQFRLGDTLCEDEPFQYEGQWDFPPECFARIRCADTARRKQFDKGLSQLIEEGVVHVLTDGATSSREPVLAAVGELQFDVVRFRLESEYDTRTAVDRLPYSAARWIDAEGEPLSRITLPSSSRLMYDHLGAPLVLFTSEWEITFFREKNPNLQLSEVRGSHALRPAGKRE